MGLQAFERRLESLVEGAFGKAFKSNVEPVEIGRKMLRELDAGRTIGIRGSVAPNDILIELSDPDYDKLSSFADALVAELCETAREHARAEGYVFVGPVSVALVTDDARTEGTIAIHAAIVEGQAGRAGSLVLSDGKRIVLGTEPVGIGRLGSNGVVVSDPSVSRNHAEVKPDADGFVVIDLGSMNGTQVNGATVPEHHLVDGDVITVGPEKITFEQS